MTVDTCRRLLGPAAHGVPDSQLEELLDGFTELAQFVVDTFVDGEPARTPGRGIAEDDVVQVQERAAILEFDAGLPREVATRKALAQFKKSRQAN